MVAARCSLPNFDGLLRSVVYRPPPAAFAACEHVAATGTLLATRDQIEKYRMSDEDYDKRAGTLRAFKREQLAKDPTFKFFPKKAADDDEDGKRDVESHECIAGITVGSRCEVQPGGRRGTVAYVGYVPQIAPGYWVSGVDWRGVATRLWRTVVLYVDAIVCVAI